MSHWPGSIGPLLIGALAIVLAGCVAGGGSGSAGAPTASATLPPPSPTATARVTSRPSHDVARSPAPPSPRPAGPTTEAPLATLLAGGAAHPGEVGGFDFGTATQSSPWLPATALDRVDVAAGTPLRVVLDGRGAIADWAAGYARADDTAGDAVTALASGAGPEASFEAPPAGDWVLSVTVVYADGAGTGAYYWHLVIA